MSSVASRSDPSPEPFAGRLFLIVLAAALLVRLPPMLFEVQLGRDLTDHRNIALNLARGRGYTLDIKSFHIYDSPVSHYGGYDRPPLLPFLLRGLHALAPPALVGQITGPMLFMLLLFFMFDLARRLLGSRAAFGVGLLFAVQPYLYETSLIPLTEILTITMIGGALWAWIGLQRPGVTGLFCALSYLARPNSLIAAVLIGVAVAGDLLPRVRPWLQAGRETGPARADTFRRFAVFAGCAGLGPLALVVLNAVHGAPLLLKPQGFLFTVLDFRHQLNLMHADVIHESAIGVIAAHPGQVIHRICRNGFHYLRVMAGAYDGFGYALPLVPLALVEIARRPVLRPVLLAVLIAGADLLFYTCMWATNDTTRFLCVPQFCLTLAVGIGTWSALTMLETVRRQRFAPWIPMLLLGVVAGLWCLRDVYRGATAWNRWRTGHGYTTNLDALWNTPDVHALKADLDKVRRDGLMRQGDVIASTEPWLINTLTDQPCVTIPYDLKSHEWLPFLEKYRTVAVVLHGGVWPSELHDRMRDLMETLDRGGWRRISVHGAVGLWLAPAT